MVDLKEENTKMKSIWITILIALNIWSFAFGLATGRTIQLRRDTAELQDAINKGKQNPKIIYGNASYYSYTIANYDSSEHFVCAVRDFPRGSWIRVTYGIKSINCLVTDYGPNKDIYPERVIDLSPRVFQELAPLNSGIIKNIKIQLKDT